jgi:indolepyruvate ferredoxin oxidoreductase beta subunit
MASRVIAGMLALQGYNITIGDTFGSSQRGGSVMSHIRVSSGSVWSPQIPKCSADFIISIEPTEAIRMLTDYGNRHTAVVSNERPVHSMAVISGAMNYPPKEDIENFLYRYSARSCLVNATEEAIKLGNPILGNIIIIGAAVGMNLLPIGREDFRAIVSRQLKPHLVDINVTAFDIGFAKTAAIN